MSILRPTSRQWQWIAPAIATTLLTATATVAIADTSSDRPTPRNRPVGQDDGGDRAVPREQPRAGQAAPGPVGGGGAQEEFVNLNLQDQRVEDLVEYIVRWTGKVVMLKNQIVSTRKITVMSDKPVPKRKALELLFQAFKLNNLAVVETDDLVMIDELTSSSALQPGVVLGPEVDVEAMDDDGNLVTKLFQVRRTKAADIFERIQDSKPEYVKMTVDPNSNQLLVESDIGYLKRVSQLVRLLDVEPYIAVKTETFRLAYADAGTIADLIRDLFESDATASSSRQSQQRGNVRGRTQQPQRGADDTTSQIGTSEVLTVTVLEQTNSITVRAEPDILGEIRTLLENAWDVAPSREGDIFKIYDLQYTDPIKVKNTLGALLESGGGTSSAGAARGGGAQGGATNTSADIAIRNIFRIEAYPDSNRLIVISKTPDNFQWLDALVARIDQPLSVGLPKNIELKHASAIEVAEILNALLAEAGSGTGIREPAEGLTGIDFNVGSGDTAGAGTAENNQGDEIQFPWQNARSTGEDATEVSALVGKARVVPNSAQNSLLVLATPEISTAIEQVISDLDRPGRQVMITAVLAEVELGDEFAFGLRFGDGITPSNPDNAVVINADYEGTREGDFFPDLTTSILSFGVNTNVILQALDEKTGVRILQEPRIFTSDNKEAKFFDGSDVSIREGSTTDAAGTSENFTQIPVGIGVNVRPRITREKNVAMEIEILLSNVNPNPGFAVPGGNPVIDRRQTNTTVTIKNGQTIVISGIRSEGENTIKRKVPLLGDIPVLDWVFSSTEEIASVNELLVFITPIVVDNPDENDVNFNQDERRTLERLSTPQTERGQGLRDRTQELVENADEDIRRKRDQEQKRDPEAGGGTSGAAGGGGR